MNTTYADYVIEQIEEVMDLYEVDGWFIDIVRYLTGPCVCATCLRQMQAEGVDPTDSRQLHAFAQAAERRFMARTSQAIRARDPSPSIFYNARLNIDWDPERGNRPEVQDLTHFEIESLPGGFWGYDHFPLSVRYFQTFGLDLLAMTGRFHTMWGDFGGLRNQAALSFECFQALAHGAVISIGDQLHPRGRLDPAVYARIGEVYAEVERREPWCVDTEPLPEIGVIVATTGISSHEGQFSESDRGALHLLEQCKHQFEFIDAGADLSPYRLVILPDEVPMNETLADKVRAYLASGGRLLVTGRSGLDETAGDFFLAREMGVHYVGPAPFSPDYLVLEPGLADGVESMHHSCEERGVQIRIDPGLQVLARSGVPYFNRTWEHFCSHQYTPMSHATDDPLIVQNGDVIYCARPLFREYAVSSRRVHKQVLANCIQRLLPRARIGTHNLPSTAIVTVRRQSDDLIVHVLHYVHQRRGKSLDVIEDVLPLHDVRLSVRTARAPSSVRLVPEGEPLEATWQDGYVHLALPRVDGYQIIRLVDAADR
jgi:hypothetical protein